MPYPALPDRRMPYDNDGTLVYYGSVAGGANVLYSNAQLLELQNTDSTVPGVAYQDTHRVFLFFPEQREVTGVYIYSTNGAYSSLGGSNDTTNGQDGTWETASLPSGFPESLADAFRWRSGIKPVSFTGPKKNLRINGPGGQAQPYIMHWYGEAAAGQMAHDLEFIDQDASPSPIPFTAPEDFGDQPLGTTVVRQFRVKNTSATRTATNVNIQCNDADFAISTDGINWVVTINIASLGPGVESATYYVRCTTPAPGAALGPRTPARIIATCDAGFFG